MNFDEEIDDEEEGEINVFPRQYAEKFLLRFEELRFSLQLCEELKGIKKCNVREYVGELEFNECLFFFIYK